MEKKEEFRLIDERTLKLIAIHRVLNLRSEIGRLYVSRKNEKESSLVSMIAQIHQCKDSGTILKEQKRITAADNSIDSIRTDTKVTKTRKWEEKKLYGYF